MKKGRKKFIIISLLLHLSIFIIAAIQPKEEKVVLFDASDITSVADKNFMKQYKAARKGNRKPASASQTAPARRRTKNKKFDIENEDPAAEERFMDESDTERNFDKEHLKRPSPDDSRQKRLDDLAADGESDLVEERETTGTLDGKRDDPSAKDMTSRKGSSVDWDSSAVSRKEIYKPEWVTPAEFRGQGITEEVIVRIAVNKQGYIKSARVIKKSIYGEKLDRAVVNYIRKIRFNPVTQDKLVYGNYKFKFRR